MTFIELFQGTPAAFIAVVTVVGLMVGSFLNVVIHRLPKMMEREWRTQCAELQGTPPSEGDPAYNLVIPRSACPSCGHPIAAWQNIPILSYLWLKGRCKHCRSRISPRYPVVEALTGIVSGYAAWHFGFGAQALTGLIFCWMLIALTFIDLDTQLLPDSLTQPLIWAGLLVNLTNTFTSLPTAVIGATAGYLVLWSVFWLFKLATGKEGMGYGDFKLLGAIGAWLGWQMLPLTILLSSLVGAAVGITLMLFARHGRDVPIPFGPYLAGGGLIALFWGGELTQAYLGLF